MSDSVKLARNKTSEAVAEYILGDFLAGRLRPGDRIDLHAVADELGVSRAPVREALILLERDGTVSMPFHRGAFMGPIDAAAVREGFTLYALLSGLTAERATRRSDKQMLTALAATTERALAGRVAMEYEVHAREFRRIVNIQAAGPHLKAMLRTFNGLVLAVSKLAVEEDRSHECELLAAELASIRSGDPAAAATAAIEHVRLTGERGVDVLVRRGVFGRGSPLTTPASTNLDEEADLSLDALVAAVTGRPPR